MAVAQPITNNIDDVDMKQDDLPLLNNNELIAKNLKQAALSNDIRSKLPAVVLQLYDYKPKYTIDSNTGSVTFYPSPHLKAQNYGSTVFNKEKFINSNQLKHFLNKLGCKSIESIYDWNAEIIRKNDSFNGFVRAMEIAYFDHYPLRISVSHIWLLIMHALASHIDINSEKLRKHYVTHDGKQKLIVNRPNFVKGSKNNDWSSVINEFTQQIDDYTVNNIVNTLDNNFSVTTNLEKIASKVSLMAACKHYFSYVVRYGCGFQQITLNGNKNDWINLKKKVQLLFKDKMDKMFINKWSKPLFNILDRFIDVFNGEIDCLFWNSMVRRGQVMSGMMIPNDDPSNKNSYYGGWINILFPYLNQMKQAYGGFGGFGGNNHSNTSGDTEGSHIDADGSKSSFEENNASFEEYNINQHVPSGWNDDDDDNNSNDVNVVLKQVIGRTSSLKVFPIGLANAPVLLKNITNGQIWKLKFAAGFIGVDQDPNTLEIYPKVGWFIAEQ